MIYLIGGSPRSGKTILSKRLANKLNAQYISTDILRLFMLSCLDEADKYKYFPFEQMFDLAGSVDTFYKKTSGDEMLSADIKEAENLMPGILAFIDYFKNKKLDYIIEGVHFLPHLIEHLKKDESIRMIILGKSDNSNIYKGLVENKGKDDWIADNIEDGKTLENAAKSLAQYGEYFEIGSTKHGLKFINTEDNFADKIDAALAFLE